ncbi:MAG: biotin/lipoyl-containing protein [Desulfobacteraceae bacterium]
MRHFHITIGSEEFDIEILEITGDQARVKVNGVLYDAQLRPLGRQPSPGATRRPRQPVSPIAPPPATPPPKPSAPSLEKPVLAEPAALGTVVAPMPGLILDVMVRVGDQVQSGDTVAKLEAMKMENDLRTPVSGTVTEVRVNKGASVSVGEVLVVVAEA